MSTMFLGPYPIGSIMIMFSHLIAKLPPLSKLQRLWLEIAIMIEWIVEGISSLGNVHFVYYFNIDSQSGLCMVILSFNEVSDFIKISIRFIRDCMIRYFIINCLL